AGCRRSKQPFVKTTRAPAPRAAATSARNVAASGAILASAMAGEHTARAAHPQPPAALTPREARVTSAHDAEPSAPPVAGGHDRPCGPEWPPGGGGPGGWPPPPRAGKAGPPAPPPS